MRGRRFGTVLVGALAVVALATACGSDDDGADAADTSSTTAPAAAGTTVESDDGFASLFVPDGALATDVELTVTAVEDLSELPSALDASGVVGTVYELGPDGTTFDEPVTLTLTYETGGLAEVPLLAPFTMSEGVVEPMGDIAIVQTEGAIAVSGTFDHFSYAGVVGADVVLELSPDDVDAAVGDTFDLTVSVAKEDEVAPVSVSSVSGDVEDPAVLAVGPAGANSDGGMLQSFECVGAGTSGLSVDASIDLAPILTTYVEAALAGPMDGTATLIGRATCADDGEPGPPTTGDAGGCDPVTFGDPAGGTTPVTINDDCLEPLYFAFVDGADPYWHIHTQQDDVFISLELYTVYGADWTGQTGSFPLDCGEPLGLCLLFDPDGTGPLDIGMWGAGDITIDALDDGGYSVTFGGTMPPAADGTVYDIQTTTWAG